MSLQGADAYETRLEVILRGQRTSQVTVNAVSVEIVERGQPLDGIHVVCPVGGASADPTGLLLDLDSQTWVYQEQPAALPVKSLPLTLEEGEAEILRVYASTADSYIEWQLKLLVTDDRRQQWLTIRDGDDPFRTTALDNQETFEWQDGEWISWSY